MPTECIKLTRSPRGFEGKVYSYLCEELEKLPNEYTVLPPFTITIEEKRRGEIIERRRQIDGLVISSYCVFTIEAKGIKGKVIRGNNTPTEVLTEEGLYNFGDRDEEPADQAENQWKALDKYFRTNCHFGKIFIKPIIVFEVGSSFNDVYRDFRNVRNKAPFMCALDELPKVIENLKAITLIPLDRKAQNVIVKAIKDGPETLSAEEKIFLNRSFSEQPPGKIETSDQKPSPEKVKENILFLIDLVAQFYSALIGYRENFRYYDIPWLYEYFSNELKEAIQSVFEGYDIADIPIITSQEEWEKWVSLKREYYELSWSEAEWAMESYLINGESVKCLDVNFFEDYVLLYSYDISPYDGFEYVRFNAETFIRELKRIYSE